MTYSNQWKQDMPPLSTVPSAAMSWPIYTSLSFNSTLRWMCLFCKRTLLVALAAFGLSERYSLGRMFGLKICQFDTCLFHLTVCTCVHCQSLCVLRLYVCIYMSVNCIVYFSSMIWPLIVLRKRKHNGSLSISFHISFFLMSLPSRLTHSEFSFHRK